MKLEKSEKLRGFGLFKPLWIGEDPEEGEVHKLIEEFVLKMDEFLLVDKEKKYLDRFIYHLAGLVSTLLYEPNKKVLKQKMSYRTEKIFYDIKNLINKEREGGHSHIFDHIYWYTITKEDGKKYYIFESHPYTDLEEGDFRLFTKIMDKYPFLKIKLIRCSYYFLGKTICLRFIVDHKEFIKYDEITADNNNE